MIPLEVQNIKQWTYSYNNTELKRPTYTEYKPDGALSYERAKELAGSKKYIGFYVTKSDPYMLVDIDHVNPETLTDTLPPKFLKFFLETRTYCEVSPSGNGIRAIYKLPAYKDKQLVNGNTFYTSELENKKHIQVAFAPPWNTITGNELPYSVNTIAQVSLDQLKELFNFNFKVHDLNRGSKTTFLKGDLPGIDVLRYTLMRIPIDQSSHVRRAYEKLTGGVYEHYAFWVKILMALHHYQTISDNKRDLLVMAIKWSAQDPVSYTGETDVIKKWRSFEDEKDETVTYLTLFRIAADCNIKWPYPKARKKGSSVYLPMLTQIANFKELLNFNNIVIHRSSYNRKVFYLTGDEAVMQEWFNNYQIFFNEFYGPYDPKTLAYTMLEFVQANGFIGASLGTINGFIDIITAEVQDEINFFKRYLDTPFDELPENMQENTENIDISTFDTLWGCIKLRSGTSMVNAKLYQTLFRKWWMGFIRNLYYTGAHRTNSGLLLLTGAELTYKTSFFRYLLPSFFRQEIAFTTQGFSNSAELRDVTKIAAQSMVVVFDEVEQHFTNEIAEASFKKLLDSEPATFIDKYEVSPITYTPKAIYGATSNQDKFRLSSLGLRRLFHIPVKVIDTDTELKLSWWHVINDLRKQYDAEIKKGGIPWLLPTETVTELTSTNANLKSDTNLGIILSDIWDFDKPFDELRDSSTTNFQHDETKRLMAEKDVLRVVALHECSPVVIKRTALRNALRRKCSEYTGTLREDKQLHKPRCIIHEGQAKQGGYLRWVMPPLNADTNCAVQDEYFKE